MRRARQIAGICLLVLLVPLVAWQWRMVQASCFFQQAGNMIGDLSQNPKTMLQEKDVIVLLEKTLTYNPHHLEAMYLLADRHLGMRAMDKAAFYLSALSDHSLDFIGLSNQWARFYAIQGNLPKAEIYYLETIRKYPTRGTLYVAYANNVLIKTARYHQASEALASALACGANSFTLRRVTEGMCYQQGNPETGIIQSVLLHQRDPLHGQRLSETERTTRATALASHKWGKDRPLDIYLAYMAGDAEAVLNAKEATPGMRAAAMVGLSFSSDTQQIEMKNSLNHLLAQHPDDATVLFCAGFLASRMGHAKEAMVYLKQAIEKSAEMQVPDRVLFPDPSSSYAALPYHPVSLKAWSHLFLGLLISDKDPDQALWHIDWVRSLLSAGYFGYGHAALESANKGRVQPEIIKQYFIHFEQIFPRGPTAAFE